LNLNVQQLTLGGRRTPLRTSFFSTAAYALAAETALA
jgi:hypothetical protein